MKKKTLRLFSFAAFILLLVLSACGGGSENGSNSDGEVPQEITYASTSDASGLSPIDTNDAVSSNVIVQVYETLFELNPETMEPEPLLAESYETPDDNTWVIKLKEGITFHDGTEFNAEAVKYTFEQIKDPERASPRASLLAPIDSIEVEDEYTVILKTNEPYGPMLAVLSHPNASIVSPTADQEGNINRHPVGTGPFVFDEWNEGDQIVLLRNENYWREPAQLEKITFKVVPEYSTAISMLETGDVQFLDAIPSDYISRVESLQNVEVQKDEGTRVSYFSYNMEKEPFNELEFRQAIAHAIDQEAYVNQLNGLGTYGESIIGPKVFGYDPSAEEYGYEFDPDKAREIIEENGYDEREYTILAANRDNYMKMAEVVQAQLSNVGLDVNIETMEWGAFLDAARAGEYEMTFLGWANNTGDGSELLYPNLHSDNIDSSNYTRYSDEEFDRLVEESRSIVDQELRKEILHEANIYAIQDAVWVVMEHGVVTAAYDQSVKGLSVEPNGKWTLYNVTRE